MDYRPRSKIHPTSALRAAKIVVAGGLGVGKTTFVDAVSEIPPLHMDEPITQASAGVDDLAGAPQNKTTTVGADFGRLHISADRVLYLFGAPGQTRFSPLRTSLTEGALGALVLADTRNLDASHEHSHSWRSRAPRTRSRSTGSTELPSIRPRRYTRPSRWRPAHR